MNLKPLKPLVGCLTLALLFSACGEAKPSVDPKEQGAGKAANEQSAGGNDPGMNKNQEGIITQEDLDVTPYQERPGFQFKPFLEASKPGAVIPGLKQKTVPQGMAYYKDKNWLLTSHYSETSGKPSILTVIDNATGKMIKSFELYKKDQSPYTGHAGGVAVSGKYVWISSDKQLWYIKLEDVVSQGDGHSKLTIAGQFPVESRASFTEYADGILWVGDYAYGDKYPTPENRHMKNREQKLHKGWIAGYELDKETDLIKLDADTNSAIPKVILSIPDMVQGMTIWNDQILLSQSYGKTGASSLLLYKKEYANSQPHGYVENVFKKKVPLWFLDKESKLKEIGMPPMSENIAHDDNSLYVLFESAAEMYRITGSYPLNRIYTIGLDKLQSIQGIGGN